MPLPIVADVYKCTFVWNASNAPRSASNTLYIKDQAGGHTGNDVFNAIDARWARSMIIFCSLSGRIDKIVTTKLDGSAASVDHSTGSNVKWQGQASTDFVPQGCAVVTFKTGFRGRSRRGRVYLPWIGEDYQNDGTLSSADVATAQTAWGNFLTNLVADGYPLHVVSKLHSDSIQASSVLVRPFLKTQRRRARR